MAGLEDAGFASCGKHWISRGGDASFEQSRSGAQKVENWMVGFSHTDAPKRDSEAMGYLCNELGFQGVVVTDWRALRATRTDAVPDLEGNLILFSI